jgi:hypothetical protein
MATTPEVVAVAALVAAARSPAERDALRNILGRIEAPPASVVERAKSDADEVLRK